MAFFLANNDSDHPITGTATFNVTPAQAGKYFTKIECFCFTEQPLAPHETARMPVIFFVDPKILDDPDTRDIRERSEAHKSELQSIMRNSYAAFYWKTKKLT